MRLCEQEKLEEALKEVEKVKLDMATLESASTGTGKYNNKKRARYT